MAMKISAAWPSIPTTADTVIVPLFDDGELPRSLRAAARTVVMRMAAEPGAARLYRVQTHLPARGPRLILIGAGRRAEFSSERARNVASAGIRALWRVEAREVALLLAIDRIGAERATSAAVEGLHFAMWRPETHRSKADDRRLPKIATVRLIAEGDLRAAIRRGVAIGVAVNESRRLANEPGNLMTPMRFAEEARALALAAGVEFRALDRKACAELGMNSFLSVAQGSAEPPRFVVLRWRGRAGTDYDLGLVGKGITFDSGGISIKGADGMHRMKADMSGAAAVVAAIAAIAKLRFSINVIAVAPCTENLPGGSATKPGDVFTSMSGKTVEVINTDAEGRLVLIDALTYVQREGVRRVVDVATLTAAIQIALGDHYVGLFGRPREFVDELLAAGTEAGERLWPMPLADEYRDDIRSDIADLSNSAGRTGGAIKAAAFLEAVVEQRTRWAHLDIASTYWSERDRPFAPKGPQGASVRTLIELARRLGDRVNSNI